MKNKEKYNLSHLHIVERPGKTRLDSDITYVEIEYNGKLVKEYAYANESGVKKFLEWLEEDDEEERKPTILTDKEKAYLSAVIKPFRKKVEYVYKIYSEIEKREYLEISLENGVISFPYFEKGEMYKGMGINTLYKLEELGL
jgi:hypothetical protein|nr:MAG TPA: hypothetical protein [Caudoviricetes sp.]